MINARLMYLRPGQLYKEFIVMDEVDEVSPNGRPKLVFVDSNKTLTGVLAEATAGDIDRWKQLQHPITHTIVQPGTPVAKQGDKLMLGDRAFFVHAIDDCGSLGISTIYYAEERLDVK